MEDAIIVPLKPNKKEQEYINSISYTVPIFEDYGVEKPPQTFFGFCTLDVYICTSPLVFLLLFPLFIERPDSIIAVIILANIPHVLTLHAIMIRHQLFVSILHRIEMLCCAFCFFGAIYYSITVPTEPTFIGLYFFFVFGFFVYRLVLEREILNWIIRCDKNVVMMETTKVVREV